MHGDCQRFNAYYKQANRKSGENEADLIETVKTVYLERVGKKFLFVYQYPHVWKILKEYPKWDAAEPIDGDNLQEVFGLDKRERPAGKQRAVKKQKSVETSGSTGGSQSESVSSLVSQDYRRKCDAAERAYEAQRKKDLAKHSFMHSKDERIWNSHGEDDPKWIMKGKKNEYESNVLQFRIYHRYLKYLTKKYLKKHNVWDWLRVIASDKERNSLQYCVTREYITHRSKRVADAVEAAIEDEHGPDASQHPPNDFDLWEKATGGKKKGLDMHFYLTMVQMLEETIRQLQEDNTQMRARVEIETQVQVQRQVERQVQEHMRQRELEANAQEEAREREWQRKMDDINSMLRKFNDPRPPQ
ncbi:glutathione S-transferase T3-like protein [Tanacetum coccineum]